MEQNILLKAKIEALRGKVERALIREGKMPQDPEQREAKIKKAMKPFLRKAEAKMEAKKDVKGALKKSYDKFKTKYAEWFIEHQEFLKGLSMKRRQEELEKAKQKFQEQLDIPPEIVKSLVEKFEQAIKKFERKLPPPPSVDMPGAKFESKIVKDLSEATKRIYKAKLNKLAQAGYATKESLLENQDKVIEQIETLTKAVDADKRAREGRLFYSAIFSVLHGDPSLSKPDNPYRKAFHSFDPSGTIKGDASWLGLDEFKKKQEEQKKD